MKIRCKDDYKVIFAKRMFEEAMDINPFHAE